VFLQRHFAVFACSFPTQDAVCSIYTSILGQYLAQAHFPGVIQRFSAPLVNVALTLHNRITNTFLPTAIKFHYVFNLRDLSNIFQVYKLYSITCCLVCKRLVKELF
jgi:dynein heavy chain